MSGQDATCAILFADVVGSTGLFEKLGDTNARQTIGRCLSMPTDLTQQEGGTLLQRIALRKLLLLDAAESLNDLRIPPANRLEKLSRNRRGQHSNRINDQWRICFIWKHGNAYNVEIVDYH